MAQQRADAAARRVSAASFAGRGVRLAGWTCATAVQPRRGTLVYLHGIADNRTSGVNIIHRFNALGFDVVAYDSRAHGDSTGDACTYGYFEKDDLRLVLDQVRATDVVLLGTRSVRPSRCRRDVTRASGRSFLSKRFRICARSPPSVRLCFYPGPTDASLALAETQAPFKVDQASPLAVAPFITAPVLVIDGEDDTRRRRTTRAGSSPL